MQTGSYYRVTPPQIAGMVGGVSVEKTTQQGVGCGVYESQTQELAEVLYTQHKTGCRCASCRLLTVVVDCFWLSQRPI